MADAVGRSFRSVVSPHDQTATFVELFFDLVFVFGVTKVTALLAHDLTWGGLAEALLVFWLLWWAWTQFTWALNAADTTHQGVELGTLVATGVAFFMAVSLPNAFHGMAMVFGVSYVLVRLIGLGIYVAVASDDAQRQAIHRFAGASVFGLVAVLVGAWLGGEAQFRLWGLAILLDMGAALIGARADAWNLHPEHFAERHGLIVIIALGESLIVAGTAMTSAEWSGALLAAATLAVVLTCTLWWTYFSCVKNALEHGMCSLSGMEQSSVARDAFSLMHFPLIGGVIGLAVAVEEALAHPADPLHFEVRVALAAGLVLFLVAGGLARWRAGGRPPWVRAGAAVAVLGLVFLPDGLTPAAALGLGWLPVLLVAVVEELRGDGQVPDHAHGRPAAG